MTQQSFGPTSVLSETVSIEYAMELPSLFPMNADRFCRFEVWREYRIIVSGTSVRRVGIDLASTACATATKSAWRDDSAARQDNALFSAHRS